MGLHTTYKPFIPASDHDAAMWMEQFAAGVEAKSAALGLHPAAASEALALVRDFSAKLAIAFNAETKTGPNITAKTAARNAATAAIAQIVKRLKSNPALRPADLIDLGLPAPRKRLAHRVEAPRTAPILEVIANLDGAHKLTYADSRTPTSSKKPDGVMQLLLYKAISPPGVTPAHAGIQSAAGANDPPHAAFLRGVSRSPFTVDHKPEENGMIATYFGRWTTRSGLTGPWSSPGVGMVVGFVQRGGG